MTIRISTGLKKELLQSNMDIKKNYIGTDISLGDGDGTGGLDTINATSGLDIFPVHSFVKILTPDADPNRNLLVKVLSSAAAKLEVPAGSFTTFAAGPSTDILWFDIAGCLRSIFQNCTIHLFAETRPASADNAEPGTPVCKITLNGGAFTGGEPANGLNFGEMDGDYLRRAIDPETAASEVWRGDPLSEVAVQSFRAYANDLVTGASVSAVRFDGTVTGATGGGDMTISTGTQLTLGTPVDVTQVKFQLSSAALT